MLFGVLRMPYELAMADELSRRQFYDRAQQAANRLDEAMKRIEDMLVANDQMERAMEAWRQRAQDLYEHRRRLQSDEVEAVEGWFYGRHKITLDASDIQVIQNPFGPSK